MNGCFHRRTLKIEMIQLLYAAFDTDSNLKGGSKMEYEKQQTERPGA